MKPQIRDEKSPPTLKRIHNVLGVPHVYQMTVHLISPLSIPPPFETMIRTDMTRARVSLSLSTHSPLIPDLLASWPARLVDSRLFRLRYRQYGPFLPFFGEVDWIPSGFWGAALPGVLS